MSPTPPPPPQARTRARVAFTLVEIMVVVVIIGVLVAISIPVVQRNGDRARATRFINDVRVISQAAEQYAAEKGAWPPDGVAEIPPELAAYLPASFVASPPTVFGGQWDWDTGQFGVTAAISVFNPTASLRELRLTDKTFDDGDLSTGSFRARTDGYMWVVAP